MKHDQSFIEKLALLVLAGGCIVALTWIALRAIGSDMVDPNAATLVGVIAGGLVAFGKDIVSAIRSYVTAAQIGKMSDQLAGSAPAKKAIPPTEDGDTAEAAAAGAAEAADAAQEIADDKADQAASGT